MLEPERALSFSDDGLANRPLFFSGLNSANFYMEDVGKEYEYEAILERLLGKDVAFLAIFPLGGKDAVLQRWREYGPRDPNGKPNIYLVDGDFDILWEDQMETAPNLIYLDRYNIESYFCSQDAVVSCMRSRLGCRRQEAAERIDFDGWQRFLCDGGRRLFVLFALRKHYKPGLPNVSLANKDFLDANGLMPEDKYHELLAETRRELGPDFDGYMQDLCRRLEEKFGDDETAISVSIICGKYQLESLRRYLSVRCPFKLSPAYFRSALINTFDLTPLGFLRERVTQLCASSAD